MTRMLQWWLTLGAAGALTNVERQQADRERQHREVDALLARLAAPPRVRPADQSRPEVMRAA